MTVTQAPTPGPLWMMHVIGPDDIYPAPDHATAVEWCAALNASMPKNDVLCVAVPAIWIGTPEAHAQGLSEAVKGWTSPRQRLAPTAPVEASGSEREIDLYDDKVQEGIAWTMRQWGEALGLTTWTQGDGSESVEGDVGAEIHTILIDAGLRDPETNEMAALRPQPSGETRKAVSALMRKPLAAVTSLDGTVKMPLVCLSVEERDTILTLIRPAPVASGGQDSSGEALWFEKGFTSPNVPAQDDDKLRASVEALEQIVDLGSDGEHSGDRHARCRDIARAALKSTAAKEGGEV